MTMEPEWGSKEHLRLELQHLDAGVTADGGKHLGTPVRFKADDPELVIMRAREVLRAADIAMLRGWHPDDDEVPDEIPAWFRAACARDDQSSDQHWSLREWLGWVDLNDRQWSWCGALVVEPQVGVIRINTTGWPYPSGALRWLLAASGARDVEGG